MKIKKERIYNVKNVMAGQSEIRPIKIDSVKRNKETQVNYFNMTNVLPSTHLCQAIRLMYLTNTINIHL